MFPESDDRFDQELAGWFSLRGGAWSGTAAALLASVRARSAVGSSLWPQSPGGLYAHLMSHRQILQALGVDVLLHQGIPRMVSLRSCQHEQPPRKPPSDVFDIDRASDTPTNLSLIVEGQKTSVTDSSDVGLAASEEFKGGIPTAKSDSAGKFVNKYADGDNFEGGVFKNTGEALFAIVEMRRWIRERGLDLESVVNLVVGRAQEITQSCGIAVSFLPRMTIGYPARTGIATSMKGVHFAANLFQPRLMAGEAVQLQDAQKHPLLGAKCQREGIASLIIVPIFHDQEVAGAMEFLFHEKVKFSAGDAMDLGLIAGVISENFGGVTLAGVTGVEGRESIEVPPGQSSKKKEYPGDHLPITVRGTIGTETESVRSSTPQLRVLRSLELAATFRGFWRAVKGAVIGNRRGM